MEAGEIDKQLEFYANATSDGGVIGQPSASTGERRKRAPMSDQAKAEMVRKRRETMARNGTKTGRQRAS